MITVSCRRIILNNFKGAMLSSPLFSVGNGSISLLQNIGQIISASAICEMSTKNADFLHFFG